jgi:hypothetical protein
MILLVKNALHKLDCLGRSEFDQRLVLNLLCKLVNSHIDVLEASEGSLEWSNHIKPLAGERP